MRHRTGAADGRRDDGGRGNGDHDRRPTAG
jgi:hypothetical protein